MVERELDGTQRGDGSAAGGVDVDKLREIKLMGSLRELERQQGRMEVVALLGVNYKTVARALDEDRVTGRVADALELLLGMGRDAGMEDCGGRWASWRSAWRRWRNGAKCRQPHACPAMAETLCAGS